MTRQLSFTLIALITLGAVLFGSALLAAPRALPAADLHTLERANQLHAGGQYAAAASLYRQLVDKGVENADVFYNLGNALYRQGDLAQALDAYARAAQLAPRDAQIAENLARAQSEATGSDLSTTTGVLHAPVTANELAIGGLLLWTTVMLLIVARRHGMLRRRNSA